MEVLSMKRTRHTTEQVMEKLRQADVALGKGAKVTSATHLRVAAAQKWLTA
jgi:hypothetical protein